MVSWRPGRETRGFDISSLLPPGNSFEMFAFFNSRLGQAACLPGGGWYYGLDTNTPPGQFNLVTTLLHELATAWALPV